MSNEQIKDLYGRTLRTVNSHPAPTAEQIAVAEDAEASVARWINREGVSTDNMGGEYECGQIISHLNTKARVARCGGYVLVQAIWDIRKGVLVGRPVRTRFGMAYPHMRDGKQEWISLEASDRTLAKRGYEWVGAWVPATE